MRRVAERDLALLHHLEQRRLHLRGRAVDLVREQEVAEHRAELGVERRVVGAVDARADEVGRDEVGRELDAVERPAEHVGGRLHRQRLGEPRHALDQQMAARQQADQHALQHLILTGDHPPDLEQRLLESLLGLRRVLRFDAARHVLSFGVASDGRVVEQLRRRVDAVRSARARGSGPARAARPVYGKDGRADRARAPGTSASGACSDADARFLQGGRAAGTQDPPRSQTTRPCYPTPGDLPDSMRLTGSARVRRGVHATRPTCARPDALVRMARSTAILVPRPRAERPGGDRRALARHARGLERFSCRKQGISVSRRADRRDVRGRPAQREALPRDDRRGGRELPLRHRAQPRARVAPPRPRRSRCAHAAAHARAGSGGLRQRGRGARSGGRARPPPRARRARAAGRPARRRRAAHRRRSCRTARSASRLGCSEPAARQRVARGLRTLKERLG